ncbi:MAG: hypothetical protein ACP5GN_07430 [Fervidicoccaceae archaeon]
MKKAYTILRQPLSSLPAKYHAPISLLIHSLSTGMISHDLAKLAEFDELEDQAFMLGLSHDIHQKLVEDGLSTLAKAKMYMKNKLDELGMNDYYRIIEDSFDVDACGKGNPIRGLPKEISLICHIGDMTQGRLEGIALLYWLREKIKSINTSLTVRFYSVMIPQSFARTYIMLKIYSKYISNKDHLALTSPWGLYVITYEDELPEVLDVSWDDLRINDFPIDYHLIKKMEANNKKEENISISVSNDELKNKIWTKFAKMFFDPQKLNGDNPIYPVLPSSLAGMFFNIKFTDVVFRDLKGEEGLHICPLCGISHLKEHSFGVSVYPKVAFYQGKEMTTEKWNRRLPGHIIVRTWAGQWKHGYGLDPLCILDAIAIRELKITSLEGVIASTISKPIPINLFQWVGLMLRNRESLEKESPDKIFGLISRMDELVNVGGVVIDFVTATAATRGKEPNTDSMLKGKELRNIGFLIEHGIYPIKYLQSLEMLTTDRLFVSNHVFSLVDFPVTSEKYRNLVPWVAALLRLSGTREKKEGLEILYTDPIYAPLRLLSIDKEEYTHVSELMHEIGVYL